MRVLFIINGLRLGGMERQFFELIRCLSGLGIEPILAVLFRTKQPENSFRPYLVEDVIFVPKKKILMFKAILRLVKVSIRLRADLYHVQDSLSAFYAILPSKLLRVPLVNGCVRHSGVTKGFDYLFERITIIVSDAVVGNSKIGLKYYHLNRGLVLYNFINLSRFRESTHNMRMVVMVANFTDYKDQLTAIRATTRLLDEGRIDHVGFVGDGPKLQYCRSIVNKGNFSNKYHFYGAVDDIENVLVDYGIGIMCSTIKYREGISNSILEYMGTGLVSVGSDVGGTPEIIKHGVNGFLVEPESETSLYKAILYIHNHECEMDYIRSNAKATLKEQFDPMKNSTKLLYLYCRLLRC